MNKNYLLCGVGGQGTVLAAKVIAEAAIARGEDVKTTETIGMAQRGGPVTSFVRTGENIHSPIIPLGTADAILGFEPGEVVRNLSYLKPGGTVVVNSKAQMPVTAALTGSDYNGNDRVPAKVRRPCYNSGWRSALPGVRFGEGAERDPSGGGHRLRRCGHHGGGSGEGLAVPPAGETA